MSRPLRQQYPGATHHVMNRGAWRRNIFHDAADRRLFLKLVGEAVDEFKLVIHAYCLMGNHFHLLTEVPKANLDLAMHHVASNYVRAFNKRHGGDGPMFRSRYTSLLIEHDRYFMAVARYICRNPLAFGVDDLSIYPWSSMGAVVGNRPPQRWLTIDEVLRRSGGADGFEAFVGGPFDGELERVLALKTIPSILGSPDFKAQVLGQPLRPAA